MRHVRHVHTPVKTTPAPVISPAAAPAPVTAHATAPAPGTASAPAATPTPAPVSTPAPSPTPVADTAAAPAPAASTLPAAQTCGLSNFQQDLMNAINQARANSRMCGSVFFNAAPALQWNSKLFTAAAGHSDEMATKNYFAHDSANGATSGDRLHDAGYPWSRFGENIAAGQATVATVMQAWIDSPGHCENLMQPGVTEVGVACSRNDSATYRLH